MPHFAPAKFPWNFCPLCFSKHFFQKCFENPGVERDLRLVIIILIADSLRLIALAFRQQTSATLISAPLNDRGVYNGLLGFNNSLWKIVFISAPLNESDFSFTSHLTFEVSKSLKGYRLVFIITDCKPNQEGKRMVRWFIVWVDHIENFPDKYYLPYGLDCYNPARKLKIALPYLRTAANFSFFL